MLINESYCSRHEESIYDYDYITTAYTIIIQLIQVDGL